MNEFMKNFSLEGKIAFVTGASYGIGFAIANALSAAGATIVFNDINQDLVNKGLAAYEEKGIKAHGYVCDVTDEEAVQKTVAQIREEVGVIDILVNNAGITRDDLVMRMKEEDFDAVLATNLKGAFLCCKTAARTMIKQRFGRVVNVSSVVGLRGNAGQSNYAASKAGLIGLTKSLAKELATRGVTVNAVAPGFIDTDMTAVLPETARTALLDTIPMKRLGTGADVAAAVAFFASEEAGYLTGQVLCVDGGMAV